MVCFQDDHEHRHTLSLNLKLCNLEIRLFIVMMIDPPSSPLNCATICSTFRPLLSLLSTTRSIPFNTFPPFSVFSKSARHFSLLFSLVLPAISSLFVTTPRTNTHSTLWC
ncbi:hypothetical protein BLNAU_5833 [Blattamonas nauphoetae]|uniref:Uncharacterized protein n=1 Tax=Blattamonas nauphoetae TaxID=2049346 RepID=A0ABQ9Y685_9EUKA|nr:hypothetical protein BLNAU_5833 [Blattamonas nauphoetae]